jgi:hypothetical protein
MPINVKRYLPKYSASTVIRMYYTIYVVVFPVSHLISLLSEFFAYKYTCMMTSLKLC